MNSERSQTKALTAETRNALAVCYWREGHYAKASRELRLALELSFNDEMKARVIHNTAMAAHYDGRADEALSILDQHASLFEKASLIVRGNYHNERGLILWRMNRFSEALAEYRTSSDIYEQASQDARRATVKNNIVLCLLDIGETSEARCVLREVRGIYEQEQDREGLAMVLETEARILLSEGKTKEAARYHARDRAPLV
jgi:tetratricopeptide (TPR) repeat protein